MLFVQFKIHVKYSLKSAAISKVDPNASILKKFNEKIKHILKLNKKDPEAPFQIFLRLEIARPQHCL